MRHLSRLTSRISVFCLISDLPAYAQYILQMPAKLRAPTGRLQVREFHETRNMKVSKILIEIQISEYANGEFYRALPTGTTGGSDVSQGAALVS